MVDSIRESPKKMIVDLSYIPNLIIYDRHHYEEQIGDFDCDAEIQRLSSEMSSQNIDSIPFDKWDYYTIFSVASLEVAGDFIFGDPKKGISASLSDTEHPWGKWLNDFHDHPSLAHPTNPLDYQGKDHSAGFSFAGGNHRALTFGHDLLAFPLALWMLCNGRFLDGYYVNKKFQWLIKSFPALGTQISASPFDSMPFDEAVLNYLCHMFADFCSTKSLPVPGFGILAHIPSRTIRQLVAEMYKGGFNLRHVLIQGIPVAIAEILVRIVCYVRLHGSAYSPEMKRHKVNRMLLMTHGVSALVNIGKVAITKNPCLINLPMLLRVMALTWSVVKEDSAIKHRAILKGNTTVLRTKYELLKTMILLDQVIFYTDQIDDFVETRIQSYYSISAKHELDRENMLSDLESKLRQFKSLGRQFQAKDSRLTELHTILGQYKRIEQGLPIIGDRE